MLSGIGFFPNSFLWRRRRANLWIIRHYGLVGKMRFGLKVHKYLSTLFWWLLGVCTEFQKSLVTLLRWRQNTSFLFLFGVRTYNLLYENRYIKDVGNVKDLWGYSKPSPNVRGFSIWPVLYSISRNIIQRYIVLGGLDRPAYDFVKFEEMKIHTFTTSVEGGLDK